MDNSRNDELNLQTRVVSGIILIILLLTFVALYIFPDNTATDFAWTILPRTSAILIGVAYMAGAYFFIRIVVGTKWHRVHNGFLPITAFTICMLAATLLHWQRFHQGTLIFYLWTAIYVVTPFVVPVVWWRNRGKDPHTLEENDLMLSSQARLALRVAGVVGLLVCLTAFIMPGLLINIAPWKLTELTARIFTGWVLLVFAALLTLAADGRWSATRILVQSILLGHVLLLLAVPRMWSDFDKTNLLSYVFVGGLTLSLIALVVMHIRLDKQSQRK